MLNMVALSYALLHRVSSSLPSIIHFLPGSGQTALIATRFQPKLSGRGIPARGILSWARPRVRTARFLGALRNDHVAFALAQERYILNAPRPRRFAMHGISRLSVRKRRHLLRAGRTGKGAQKRKNIYFHVPQHTPRRPPNATANGLCSPSPPPTASLRMWHSPHATGGSRATLGTPPSEDADSHRTILRSH